MANFLTDNEDLQFYLDKGIDWAPLIKATERGDTSEEAPTSNDEAVALYRDMAEMVGQFTADEVVPRVKGLEKGFTLDERGEAVAPPELDEIFAKMSELDITWLSVPRELGGMNCPMVLNYMVIEMLARADTSVTAHYGFHTGIATTLLLHSIREGTTTFEGGRIASTRFQTEIEEISRGDAWGSMDITEPNAGSDMAALRTTARQDETGQWRVSGEKIFITSGHGKYHVVIARSEDAEAKPGLEGLSLFLVRAYEDHDDGSRTRFVQISRLEEKLGHHGSATCALNFDDAPAELIGQRGEGFKYMLVLMNMARLHVGFESVGLSEAAFRVAKDYAEQRPSMGKTIDKHEMIADMLDEMATDIQGLRALAVQAAVHEELGTRLQLYVDQEPEASAKRDYLQRKAKRHAWGARRMTPLLKYLASEKSVEISRRAIQILGGNGYTTEYGVEKLLRDAVVLPIWEGTSQIQALMAMKDTLGDMMKRPQEFVRRMALARWKSLSSRNALDRRVARLQTQAYDVQQFLLRKTATDKFRSVVDRPITEWSRALLSAWDPKRDFRYAMLHAERLARMLADVAICEILLEQTKRFPEREAVLLRYLDRAEPRCRYLADVITNSGERLLDGLAHSPDKVEAAE